MCGNVEEYIQGNYGLFEAKHVIDPKGFSKPWGTLDSTLQSSSYMQYKECFQSCHRHGSEKGPSPLPQTGFRVLREINQH